MNQPSEDPAWNYREQIALREIAAHELAAELHPRRIAEKHHELEQHVGTLNRRIGYLQQLLRNANVSFQ